MTRMRITTSAPGESRRCPTVDMTHDARLAGRCPTRCSPRPGCAAAGRELDQFFDVAELGAVVTKSIMLRAAVGPGHAADGRDAERHAQLDRPAGPGHRRVRRATTCAWLRRARRARRRVDRRRHASTSTPSWPRGCAAHAGVVGDRGQHLLPERRGPRPGVRLRPGRSRARSSARCGAAAAPGDPGASPSSRPTSPTSSRSPGPCVDAGADGLSLINTAARHGDRHRHDAPGARRRHRRPVRPGDPAGRACAASGRCTRRCPTCRSSAWAASAPGSTRWSSSWPARRAVSVGTVVFDDPSRAGAGRCASCGDALAGARLRAASPTRSATRTGRSPSRPDAAPTPTTGARRRAAPLEHGRRRPRRADA